MEDDKKAGECSIVHHLNYIPIVDSDLNMNLLFAIPLE